MSDFRPLAQMRQPGRPTYSDLDESKFRRFLDMLRDWLIAAHPAVARCLSHEDEIRKQAHTSTRTRGMGVQVAMYLAIADDAVRHTALAETGCHRGLVFFFEQSWKIRNRRDAPDPPFVSASNRLFKDSHCSARRRQTRKEGAAKAKVAKARPTTQAKAVAMKPHLNTHDRAAIATGSSLTTTDFLSRPLLRRCVGCSTE